MKFWQRQILLSAGLVSLGLVFFLHSRGPTPDHSVDHRDSWTAFTPNPQPPLGSQDITGLRVQKVKMDLAAQGKNEAKKIAEVTRQSLWIAHNQTSKNSECPKVLRPDNVTDSQIFQKVDGQGAMYVFSAFLDLEQKLVRVVGLASIRGPRNALCLLWYRKNERNSTDTELKVVPAVVTLLPEHHGRKYGATYMECSLPDPSIHPYAVSVTSEDCRLTKGEVKQPNNAIPVQQAATSPQPKYNFTVCVTALNYRYSRAHELVEMIELNRILGANRFTFYSNSIGDNVAQVLKLYQKEGVVEVVDWKLPVVVDHWPPSKEKPEVHYFAQLASHNDCLNRNRGRSRYLVYQDLDEFIIPKNNKSTWSELIESLHKNSAAYVFRCNFFRKDWPSNSESFSGKSLSDKFRSIVLATDKRKPNPYPFSQRAKYIVDPNGIHIVGIHNIWKYRGPTKLSQVKETEALMHHYRSWENPRDAGRAVRDTDIYRFKDKLLKRLEERWAQLPGVPLDIPLSEYGQV